MFEFGLPIFPFNSTAITVTTTVWVGVCIAVFFNLRFGWTLSGLVIPGYLVPLLLTRPTTAGVILLEAVLTYLIVIMLSEWPRKLPYWSSFFGRDRFFAILVVSVLVRAILDGWLLPYVGRIAVEEYGINFDYRNNLHSFGLIAVALIANYFWKPGVLRGLVPLLTCVGLTYLVIAFPLVGWTNFNLGNFHLLYEDISTSLLASPKAYIIVLMTAYLASCFNLRYAWDFNGILIPALLGLLWHQPAKIIFSAIECVLILAIASYLLKTRWFQNVTIEGGRKLLFFFTICFCYRLILCHLLPLCFPGLELSDTFGFGYLLSTLMAVKAHDKRLVVRMIRSITEVSMLGAVAGSLVGFAFYCGPDIRFDWTRKQLLTEAEQERCQVVYTDRSLTDLIRADKILLYEKQKPESYQPPVPFELTSFRSILTDLQRIGNEFESTSNVAPTVAIQGDSPTGLQSDSGQFQTAAGSWPRTLRGIAQRLKMINYELVVVQNRYFYLREFSPANGWGIYVIDPQHQGELCIEVPAPLDEKATVESGLCLFHRFKSSGLAIAGAPRAANITGSADVTKSNDTMFAKFHQVFGKTSPLQVRGLVESVDPSSLSESYASRSQLWLRGSIPESLKLRKLKEMTGSFQVLWNDRPFRNQIRQHSRGRVAELILGEQDRRALVGHLFQSDIPCHSQSTASSDRNIDQVQIKRQSLQDWMGEFKNRIGHQGSDAYRPATVEQMLYMDHEVVTPLIRLVGKLGVTSKQNGAAECFWDDETFQSHLLPIQSAAVGIGYQVIIVADPQTQESYVVLGEPAHPNGPGALKGWGTFVFRPGLAEPFAVEVPRPLFERRSFEFGVNLFQRPRASVLLVAGAHPFANMDGSSDISKVANKVNLFNLVRHVLLREFPQRPLLVSQARAIQAPVDADVVVATDDGTNQTEQLTPLKQKLLEQLLDDQLQVAFVDGRHETAGYELGILMQATGVQVSRNKEVVSLWLSPSLRTKFREQSENNALAAQFEVCELPTVQRGLIDYLMDLDVSPDARTAIDSATPIPNELRRELREYVDNFDVVKLLNVTQEFRDWNFVRLVDGVSGQAFLLISRTPTEFPTVLNLTGYVADRTITLKSLDPDQVNVFIRSRALWLEPAAKQVNDVSQFSNSPRSQKELLP